MSPGADITPADALVGAIALAHVLLKLKPLVEDNPEFCGAFHVLSGFSAEQLVGFVRAKAAAGPRASRLQLQLPESALKGYGVDASCLTSKSPVDVRNRDRDAGG